MDSKRAWASGLGGGKNGNREVWWDMMGTGLTSPQLKCWAKEDFIFSNFVLCTQIFYCVYVRGSPSLAPWHCSRVNCSQRYPKVADIVLLLPLPATQLPFGSETQGAQHGRMAVSVQWTHCVSRWKHTSIRTNAFKPANLKVSAGKLEEWLASR